MLVRSVKKTSFKVLKTIVGLGCTVFYVTDVWGQNFYIFTPITGAQTQIDVNNTSTFQINVSAGASLNLGGAVLTLKEGPSTTADISLTVYSSSIAAGNIVGSVNYTNSQFDTAHPGSNEQSFQPTPFPPTAPNSTFLTLAGGASGVQYFVTLTSSAPDTQSTAYFIKGADAAFLGDTNGTPVTLTGIAFFPPSAPVVTPITGTVTTNNLAQFQPILDGGTIVSDPNATTVTENISITNNNGTLDANSITATYSGNFTGTGGLAITNTGGGPGVIQFTGANTYSGSTTINGGTLQAGATNTFSSTSAVTVNSPGTLDLNNFNQTIGSLAGSGNTTLGSATLTTGGNNTSTAYSGAISGTGALIKEGTGTLTLTGTNTYTGGTEFKAGTVNVGSTGALGTTGTLSFTGGTLQYSTQNTTDYSSRFSTAPNQLYSIDTNGQNVTFASNLTSSGGSLTKLGAGTLTLSGNNTYSGGTSLDAGTIAVTTNTALGSGTLTFAGGTTLQAAANSLSLSNNLALNGIDTIDTNGNTLALTGIVSGGGTLNKIGSGTLTLSGVNTYTGGTTLNAGTLAVASNTALGTGTLTFADGTTLQAAANGLSLSNNFALNGSGTIDTNGNALQVSGVLSGAGSLNKIGTGALTLSGNNTYAGVTNINAGALILSGSNQSSAYNIAPNATLTPTVSNAFSSGADINNSGTLNLAGVNGLTPINVVADNFVQTSTGTTEVYIGSDGTSSNLDLGGNLTLAGTLDVNTNPAAGTGSVPPYSAGQTFGVITYDGTRTGVFANITDDLAQFDIKADYSQPGVVSLVLIPVLTTSPTSLPGFVPTSIATQTAGNALQISTNTATGSGSGGVVTNLAQQTAQNRLNTVGVLTPQPVTASSAFSLTQATGSAVVNQERTFQKSVNTATVGGSTTTIAETIGNQTANNFMNGASLSLVASGQLLLSQTTRQLDLSRVETTNSASATSGAVANVGSATTTTAQNTGNFVNTATVAPVASASVGLQQSLGGIGAYAVPNPVTNLPINTDGLATVTTNNATATSNYSLGAGGSAGIRNVGQNADLNLNGFSSTGTGALTLSGSQNGTLRAFVDIGNTANATGSTGNASVVNTAQSSDINLNTVAAGGAVDLGTGSAPFLQITQDISHLEFTTTPGNTPATTYTVNTLNAQTTAGAATISNAAPDDQVANFSQNQIAAAGAITGLAEQSAAIANIPEFRNVATATATSGVATISDTDQSQTQTVNRLSGGSVSAGVTQLTTNAQSRQSVNTQTATGSKIAEISDGDQSNGIALNQLSTTTGGVSGTLSQTTTTSTLAGANTRTASGADTARIAAGAQTQLLSQNVIAANAGGVSGGITQTSAAATLTGSNSVTASASNGDAAITGLQQGQAQYANMLTGGAFSGANVNQSSTGAIAMTANNSQSSTGVDSANLLGAGQSNTLALNMVTSSNSGGAGSITQTSAATSLSSTNSLTGASTSNTASALTGVQSSVSVINMSR